MRFKTLVLIPLIAVLATMVHNKNVPDVVSLPISQSQSSANAPQKVEIEDYLTQRNAVNSASRSSMRVPINNRIVNTAKKYIGTPYCRGGETSRCFDCSGFIQYILNKNGVNIPRGVDQQLNSMTVISKKSAVPGDMVFFLNKKGKAYHVGIYVGDNKIVHSPKPGRRVKTESIWSSHIVFAR